MQDTSLSVRRNLFLFSEKEGSHQRIFPDPTEFFTAALQAIHQPSPTGSWTNGQVRQHLHLLPGQNLFLFLGIGCCPFSRLVFHSSAFLEGRQQGITAVGRFTVFCLQTEMLEALFSEFSLPPIRKSGLQNAGFLKGI